MNVLISNDDGIQARGLLQLVEEISKIGDVYVVAPEGERSSHSHHLTINGKIRVEERKIPHAKKAYAVWGTPADCTHLGLNFLIDEKIDLVISGINRGKNVSTDIIYSGTIAAAREAHLSGLPAIATSIHSYRAEEYSSAAYYTGLIALKYMQSDNKTNYFLNVNVPYLPIDEIKGIKVCDKVTYVEYNDNYSWFKEDGKDYVLMDSSEVHSYQDEHDMNIDYVALKNGYVSVSPLYNNHIDKQYKEDIINLLDK